MGCNFPIQAYRLLNEKTENGKSVVCFKLASVGEKPYEKCQVPCGRCEGCMISRSRDWAVRCVHEASLYGDNNSFITLTYSDENLPPRIDQSCDERCAVYKSHLKPCPKGSLCKKDFQDFMKRLRKRCNGIIPVEKKPGKFHYPIRYYQCGEYGSLLKRPHFHACLFNYVFPDLELFSERQGVKIFTSELLQDLWPYGYSTIGQVNFATAAYVARYVMKKRYGNKAAEHYLSGVDEQTGEVDYLEPEYTTMSRRPGIGKDWFDRYHKDVYPKDYITHEGEKLKVPSYYDAIYDEMDKEELKRIKIRRQKHALKKPEDKTLARLAVREKCLKSKTKRLIRSIENEA